MKIVLVNDYGYDLGGAESYFFTLRDLLKNRGHKVVTVSSDRLRTGKEKFKTDFQLRHSGHLFNTDSVFNPVNYFQFKKILKSINPDVVHFQNVFYTLSPSVLLAAKKYHSILTLHDYYAIYLREKTLFVNDFEESVSYEFLRKKVINKALLSVDLLVAPSEYLMKEFEANGYSKLKVINHPIHFNSEEVSFASKDYILFIGRLEKQKGVSELLDAFKMATQSQSGLKLKIAGLGSLEQSLKNKVQELGINENVEFLGFVRGNEKTKLIDNSIAVVVPSLWPEVFGLVLYEAASRGVPTIATSVGAITEFVKDNSTGLIAEPFNLEELSKKIIFSFQNKEEMKRLGQKAKESLVNYSVERHIVELEKVYSQ